jgi:hypothetical protein
MTPRIFAALTILASLFTPIIVVAATDAPVLLSVPYSSQSPYGAWVEPWQNACEETTIAMVDAFYGKRKLDKVTGTTAIRLALKLREHRYGKSLDESAETVMGLINAYYPWEARVIRNPSLEAIQEELRAGRPVIAMAHGKALKNPRFQQGGPDYHTFVLSGFDAVTKEFITQEPGTTTGQNYRYSFTTVMSALHDFVPNKKTITGVPTVLFTSPQLNTSANSDGDGDGLSKRDELRYGTVLYLSDSDGDGYTDGEEVSIGFNPTKNESALLQGTLVKNPIEPFVFRLENGTKRYIVSEQVFYAHGWRWSQVVLVSERFLASVPTGAEINR